MKRTRCCRPSIATAALCAAAWLGAALTAPAEPGSHWLATHGLKWWEFDLDQDADGFTARQEYYFGTDPRSILSAPPTPGIEYGETATLAWPSRPGVRYRVQQSSTLGNWRPAGPSVPGDGGSLSQSIPLEPSWDFLRLEAEAPTDSDADGLSSVEEGLLATDPARPDTDGDGLGDGTEVLETFTNPLVPEPAGGTITGVVRTDPNRDGNPVDGSPVAGATVWLDADFDGTLDEEERRTRTDAAGTFSFLRLPPGYYHVRQLLEPGHSQTQPAEVTPPILDSWPDEVVNYSHAATGADFPGPYGYAADRLWPGARWIIVGQQLEPVEPTRILLQPAGTRFEVPPIGIYNTTECLALPRDASVTVRFDEIIVDKPGPDIALYMPVQGAGEFAQLWLGPTPDSLQLMTRINSTAFVQTFDMAGSGARPPARFLKIVSETSGGVDLGFGFTTVQALSFVSAATDARAVTLVGTETVSGVDFARFFIDQLPVLMLEDGGVLLRQEASATLRLSVLDDIGVATRGVTVSGLAVPVNADGSFSLTPALPGTIDVTGNATDTGGQTATRTWRLYVANPDGTLPFDPEALGTTGEEGAPDIRVLAPAAGAVVDAAVPVIATIGGGSAPVYEVAYAPVEQINLSDFEADDPDYLPLASGTGYRTSETVAVFPGDTVANGIYFLRIKATPSGGGPIRSYGQIIAKGVPADSLQPRLTLTSPADGTVTGLVEDVTGSIESARPLTEWFVEVAPREDVDLNDLGSASPSWKRLAQGTAPVPPGTRLARLDSSTLPNGSYVIRVVAWNDLRLGRVEARLIEVAGEAKFGRHRREFTDLEIDLAGFPLTVKRVFDSFDTGRIGDFGYGWSLSLVDAQIGETVPRSGTGIFGQTAYRDGTRVYLTGPDGRRNGFTFHPEFVSPGVFGDNYRATFTADPGVSDRLEVPEGRDPFLTVKTTGEVALGFIGLAWNPDTFVLVRPDGTRYTYHETRGLLEATDLNDNKLTCTPAGFQHSGGMSLAFTRDPQGRITAISDGGRTWTYAYTPNGDLASVTDPDGRSSSYGYLATPPHYLASVTDPFGRTGNSYEYDADGRLVAIVDPAGNRTLQSWDPLGFIGSITDGRGHVTRLTYDQRGNTLTSTDPLGGVTRYTYGDARHPDRETAVTDPLLRTTTYTYDADGNQTSVVRPGNIFTWLSTTWNERQQPLSLYRADYGGFTESWEYDTAGNLTRETLLGEPVRTITYTPSGQIETESVAGLAMTATYDPATGLPAGASDPYGFNLSFTRNASGQLTRTTTASGETVTVVPGSDGLPRSLTDSAGAAATTVVNADGSLTINDWNGRSSRLFFDGAGRVTALQGRDGFTVTPERDANRNVTGITGPLGDRHGMEYDALNRPTRLTDPRGASHRYAYDAAGRLTETTDRNGRKKRFFHNDLDQVTREEWLDETGTLVRTWTFTYDTVLNYGRLDAISDGQTTWWFSGGAIRPGRTGVAYPGQASYEIGYTWTAEGGSVPAQVSLFRGATILHTTTAQFIGNRIYRHTWESPLLAGSSSRHVRHFFDPMGSETRLERFDSFFSGDINQSPFAVTHTTRDTKGRATQIRHTHAAGSLLFPQSQMTLARTPGGCVTGITEPGNTAVLSYDAGLQLTGITHSARPAETYAYDPAGNRLTSHSQPVPATITPGNQLAAAGGMTYAYDAEGNLVRETATATGAIREFAYDHNNQLTRVQTRTAPDAAPVIIAEYTYDYDGNRSSRTEGGVTTWVLYDRGMPLAEFHSGEATLSRLHFYDLGQIDRWFAAWDTVDGESWFLHDHLQSIRGAVRKDATPVTWVDYDAFGRLVSGDPARLGPIRFTGRPWSDATALYDFRARSYAPELGRFLQQDPSLFASGDLNLYRYAWNDPLNHTDPTGLTAAVEYAVLTCQISVNAIDRAGEIGACVSRMIGAAAAGLYGIQTGNASACAIDYVTAPVTKALPKNNWQARFASWKQTAGKQAYKAIAKNLFGRDPVAEPRCDAIALPSSLIRPASAPPRPVGVTRP